MLDCVENGEDLCAAAPATTRGPGTLGIGIADGPDSLAALEKLVFEEKRVTMVELREHPRDFAGHERVQSLPSTGAQVRQRRRRR